MNKPKRQNQFRNELIGFLTFLEKYGLEILRGKKKITRKELREFRWIFVLFIILVVGTFVTGSPLYLVIFFVSILLCLYEAKKDKLRAGIWKKFAREHNLAYQTESDPDTEQAQMFMMGSHCYLSNYVTGKLNGRAVRLFDCVLVFQRDKGSDLYRYTVFGFKFKGHFPHVYLNYRDDNFRMGLENATKLPVPAEFEKDFHLYAPPKYETEGLAIFPPDVLAYLLDEKWTCDVELIDQELLIFRPEYIKNKEELEKEFKKAQQLADRIAPHLDQTTFSKIGDYTHTLYKD